MMKAFKYTATLVLCVFVLGITTVQAKSKSNYLGESCWLVDGGDSLAFLRLGITNEGDNHYSVNGLQFERDSGEEFEVDGVVNGNMEIIGDETLMTLTSATVDGLPPGESYLVARVFYLRLDSTTLDGSIYLLRTGYNLADQVFEPMWAGWTEIQFVPDCLFP